MVAKDINEGGQGEVIIDGEVGVGDGENGEGGAVREICGEGHGKDDERGE